MTYKSKRAIILSCSIPSHAALTLADNLLESNFFAIATALENYRVRLVSLSDHPTQLPGRWRIARFLVWQDFCEISALLSLVCDRIAELRRIDKDKDQEHSRNSDNTKTVERDTERYILLRITLTSQITVLVKAIYAWLYHLREDFKAHADVRALVPNDLWSHLDRYCTFRNALITHKKGLRVIAAGGTRFGPDSTKMEMFMVPIASVPQDMIHEVMNLFDQAKPYLEPQDAAEENFYERLGILYRRLTRLPSELRGPARVCLSKYGTISDTPEEISSFMRELVMAVAPRLIAPNDGA